MSEPRWRRLLRNLVLVTAPAAALLSVGVVSGLAADQTVETAGSLGTYHWNPSTGSISAGGTIEFKNSDGTHALVFDSPPAAPSCPGVPSTGMANWSGTCTFSQAGTYQFHCPVHPTEMTGTITVTGGGPEAPSVTTEAATSVTETGATLNGLVNPHGQATTYWFEWGTSESYGQESATHASAGSDSLTHSKSEPLTGLAPETTYHFTMVAENATGTTEGVDHTFRTPGPATATTEPATGVGGAEATLVGKVNPNSQAGAKYFFNWGTTESYGHTTSEKAISGSTPATKTELVTGLSQETTYHFQVVVKYGATEVKGLDKMFTTLSFPPPLATTGSATGIGATGATVEGTVNAHGQQTTYFFNYGQTPSYGAKTVELSIGKGTSDQGVSALLAELLPDTTYHYQLVAKSIGGTTPGADQTFTTTSNIVVTPPVEEKPPPPPPVEEATPPDTKIAPKPPAKTHDRTPTIKFSASVAGASFQCSVDSKPFRACRSPFTAPSLKPGRHRIRVKAVVGGLSDPTPASWSFKVLAAKKK